VPSKQRRPATAPVFAIVKADVSSNARRRRGPWPPLTERTASQAVRSNRSRRFLVASFTPTTRTNATSSSPNIRSCYERVWAHVGFFRCEAPVKRAKKLIRSARRNIA